MKKLILALMVAYSAKVLAQTESVATYDGGELYFVPAKLTSQGVAFMYSYKDDYESRKAWFTVFDSELNVVKQAEIEPQILNYTTRTVTSQRRFFIKQGGSRTRVPSSEEGYFLDEWTVTGDVTEEKTEKNNWILNPEVYEDNNNYHSRSMYLSQSLFNDDEEFEFLRDHYEVMPLTYCAADDKTGNDISTPIPNFGGEECDNYTSDYDYELGGYVITMYRYKVYGGLKRTGIDVISLDGTIKNTLQGITYLGTVVAINGNYYVSAYDSNSSKYGLYKIATASTTLSKVAEISAETNDNVTYNLAGIRVKADTKGIVIRNGRKIVNK